MSKWSENFENLKIVQKVQGSLETLLKTPVDSLNKTQRDNYDRAIKILKYIEVKLMEVDPDLYGENAFVNLNDNLKNAQTHITNIFSSKNFVFLQNLNDTLDQCIMVLRPLFLQLPSPETKGLIDVAVIYRQKLDEELELVKSKSEEIKKQFEAFSEAIKLDRKKLSENDKLILNQNARLDSSIAEFQKQFSAAQEIRNQEFLKSIALLAENHNRKTDEINVGFESILERKKRAWDSIVEQTQSQSNKLLELVEGRKKEVDQIYGAIGAATLAGNFNDIANTERSFANVWRKIAFGFFSAMGVITVLSFILTFRISPDWETFVFRIGTVILLSIPAIYAANWACFEKTDSKIESFG
jgi:hypothetical protein